MTEQHEQWDIVTSIGFTALLVAAGRAVESCREDRLVDDPWARRFVDAAATPAPVPTRPGERWTTTGADPAVQEEVDAFWSLMTSYQGVRSRFFDATLSSAVDDGVEQVVLLAAGLDVRALRLAWGPEVTVFEIDQAAVLGFKDEVITGHDGHPTCARRTVGVDLRDDWVTALREHGFDPSRRTAWLAEGLLPFLPARAQEDLLAAVDELSAPGSVIAAEHFEDVYAMMADRRSMSALAEPFGVQMSGLVPGGQRAAAAEQLAGLGWEVSSAQSPAVARGYRRELGSVPGGGRFSSDLVVAAKP